MSMSEIQAKLKAPKGQFNNFGKYKYRSCEDIVEAVKPILAEYGYHLSMSDDIRVAGERVYVEAICTVYDGEKSIARSVAFAREPEDKKGMDASQITGTASSYARKYALNGLFAIDDTKDADSDEYKNQSTNKAEDEHAERQKALNEAVNKHSVALEAIKDYLATDEYSLAYEAWSEIPDDDKKALWVAPTKFENAPFSTAERDKMKSNEMTEARKAFHGETN